MVALLRNKMRGVLTVLGITIGIAAVICAVAIGEAETSTAARRSRSWKSFRG
jgi:ABC-type antimicrobial peptide transport system permease subunit